MSKFKKYCVRFNRITDGMRAVGYYPNMGTRWGETHSRMETGWALATMRKDGSLNFADSDVKDSRVTFANLAQAEQFILRKTAEKLCDHFAFHNKNLTSEQFNLVCELKSALEAVVAGKVKRN